MTEGVLYIAFGKKYHVETRRSIASLRRVSPSIPVAVMSEEDWDGSDRPDIFINRVPMQTFGCKPQYMYDSPFQSTLFLDTDTVVARDISDIFGLLNWYDFGVLFNGPQLNEPDGLRFHTQCSSGVILFKKNDRVQELFTLWQDQYKKYCAALNQVVPGKGVPDQRSLSIAVAKSRARPVHLAEYLNYALFTTIVTYSPPVIYHGRFPEMEKLDSVLCSNPAEDDAPKLWMQNIRGLLPNGIRKSDPLLGLALVLRRIANLVRYRYFT
jgi:hypothetical protein